MIACALGLVACSPASVGLGGDTTVPTPTPIRTAPPDPTDAVAATVAATAYATLPVVTAAPPPWTPAGWQTTEVTAFFGLVKQAFNDIGADVTINEYYGYAALDSGTQVDLTALARQVAALPTTGWADVISTYLMDFLRPTSPDDYSNYDAAKALLRVKVGRLGALAPPVQVVSQPLAGDLVATVVIDAPDAPVFVTQDQLMAWGKSPSEVLVLAIDQTRALTVAPTQTGPNVSVTEDWYASARLLDPTALIPAIPPDGIVVAISSTDTFIAVLIDGTIDAAMLDTLARTARDEFGTAEHPASDQLYWWKDGTIAPLTLQGESLVLPPELQRALA